MTKKKSFKILTAKDAKKVSDKMHVKEWLHENARRPVKVSTTPEPIQLPGIYRSQAYTGCTHVQLPGLYRSHRCTALKNIQAPNLYSS